MITFMLNNLETKMIFWLFWYFSFFSANTADASSHVSVVVKRMKPGVLKIQTLLFNKQKSSQSGYG